MIDYTKVIEDLIGLKVSPKYTFIAYVEWCKANELKPCYASSLDAYKNYLIGLISKYQYYDRSPEYLKMKFGE